MEKLNILSGENYSVDVISTESVKMELANVDASVDLVSSDGKRYIIVRYESEDGMHSFTKCIFEDSRWFGLYRKALVFGIKKDVIDDDECEIDECVMNRIKAIKSINTLLISIRFDGCKFVPSDSEGKPSVMPKKRIGINGCKTKEDSLVMYDTKTMITDVTNESDDRLIDVVNRYLYDTGFVFTDEFCANYMKQ